MQISWELTGRSFFDQLAAPDRKAVERALMRLARNWDLYAHRDLHKLTGIAGGQGRPLFALRAGADLRVILYREDDRVVIVDILRSSQLERLRTRFKL